MDRSAVAISALLYTLTLFGYSSAENSTDVNVTISVTNHIFHFRIFNESNTWFQAFNFCHEFYGKLPDLQPYQSKLNALTQFLRESNHPLPLTLWLGHFRPFPQILTWYESRNCRESNGVNNYRPVSASDGQCVAVRYNNYENYVFLFEECEMRYPFLCDKWVRTKPFVTYGGFELNVSNTDVETEVNSTLNSSICEENCRNDTKCQIYTFNATNGECAKTKLNSGIGTAVVTLACTGQNVTLGVREGSYTVTYNDSNRNYTLGTDFPDCGISPVPANYCPCQCGIPEEEFQQLITEMTVEPSTTSKSQQKYQSAEDNRPSSKGFGALGIIIIVTVVTVIVIPDVLGKFFHVHKK